MKNLTKKRSCFFCSKRFSRISIKTKGGFIFCMVFIFMTGGFNAVHGSGLSIINQSSYGITEDNLDLAGKVLAVSPWSREVHTKLDQRLFELVIIDVEVSVPSGNCMDATRHFYVKKGVRTAGIGQGDFLDFQINRNSCSNPDVLVILNISNHRSAGRRTP